MKKWALIVDVARCTNCQNCVLATKDEHMGNDHPGYAAPMPAGGAEWIRIERHTRGNGSMVDVTYVPKTCHHCEDAPCLAASSDGAVYRRPDGIVVIDPVKARGRRDLVDACPYGAIVWNEEARLPQKWSFDAHLLDAGWSAPRCVQACPTGALQSVRVEDAELQALKGQLQLEALDLELNTRPRVLYQNLRRTTHGFLGGTVTRRLAGGGLENVPGASIELTIDGVGRHCESDAFGDFKFDDLSTQSRWSLRATHANHGGVTADGVLTESRYLGPLLLT
jgi:Fe-S-cluster-containing dehydrogenase component